MKVRNINTQIDLETHKILKIQAIKLGVSIKDLFANICREEAKKIKESENK